MLGVGWYVWDARCPSGRRCVPPIYGNLSSTYIKVPENSPRTNGRDQAEAVSAPWKARIPRGNDVCIKVDSRGYKNDVAPLKTRTSLKHNNHRSPNEMSNKSNTNLSALCNLPPCFPSYKSYHQRCATECNNHNTKKMYNAMWDPKIARGPTMVQFEEAQRTKWKRQVDSHRMALNREQIRRRRKKMKEEQYLNTKSNPMRRIVYPTVTISKEPLSNSGFALFLEEQCETVEWVNAEQVTDEAGVRVGPPHGQNKKSFSSGISAGVQTDNDADRSQETEDWISSTMIEKIPEQAVLELQEEAELEALKGEQKRHELLFLRRKWQEMKRSQWNEYLREWNELRMKEILDQNVYLEEKQERICVIGFCKSAISSCLQMALEGMKLDGYINEQGMPYEESETLNAHHNYQNETEEKFESKLLARKVVDSTLINAVVQRFSIHMRDDYGRPHGHWLSKLGRHDSIAYDADLKGYLETRWTKRRAEHTAFERPSYADSMYSEASLLDIFDFYKDFSKHEHPTLKKADLEVVHLLEDLISAQRLGRRTGESDRISGIMPAGSKAVEDEHDDDDLSTVLYKRDTRWSKLEMDDHNHHQQQNRQQKNLLSPGNIGERGSRKPSDARRSRSVTIGGSLNSGVARFSEERKEVDSNKLGEADVDREKRGTKLSAKAESESRRQSQAPHPRLE